MRIEPYLQFDGNCEAALRYYHQHLNGGQLFLMPYRDSPAQEQARPEQLDHILHGFVQLGQSAIMGTDGGCPDGEGRQAMRGCSLSISVTDTAEAERIFAALAEGGQVQMPLQETFWAHKFGMLTDQFGIAWMVNCEKPM